MNKKFILCSVLVILAVLLSACQTSQTASAASPLGTPPGGFNHRQAAAATATPTTTATSVPTATATATAAPVTASAEAAARAYFAALQNKDFSGASQLVSVFSLSLAQMTRSDAADKLASLSKAGTTWSALQIVSSQVFNDSVILVHVTYQAGSTATATATSSSKTSATPAAASQTKDELWVFRLENGQWLYNWNNLIDYQTLVVSSQVREHITIKPTQLVRYSDRIELHFYMQNWTSNVIYFVQPYDSLAVFHFGDTEVEADKSTPIVISGLRTSFDEVIVVKGLYTSYPTWVEIKKWKGYYPNPWYTFQF